MVDSTLYNQTILNQELTNSDFEKLKKATQKGMIDFDFAKQIFPELEVDSSLIIEELGGKFPIELYSFDKNENDFKEFAIVIGLSDGLYWGNDVYFFNGKKVIAKHHIYHRYGLELKHFKDENNQTVIYYNVCYESGTGIWWFQYNFYRYDNEQLTPVLTEIQNINLQSFGFIRMRWIESEVINERPLQIKFKYYNHFFNTSDPDKDWEELNFINDSTIVTYQIDTKSGKFVPDFNNTKLNKNKLLSYFISENELLFINAHYDLFKSKLNENDPVMHNAILNYLNDLKNTLEKR
jgi:hypothetical protein